MTESYDSELYTITSQVGIAFDEADWLSDHLRVSHEERDRFLNNDIENPQFTYRSQTPRVGYQENLDSVLEALGRSAAPAVVIDLYKRKLEMLQLRNRLIESSIKGDSEEFFKISTELYGRPRKRYFSYVAKRVLLLCKEHKKKHPAVTRRLQKVFGRVNTDEVDIEADILPPLVTGGRLITSVSEVENIFKETLARYNIDNWSVEVDLSNSRRHFAAIGRLKRLVIPAEEHLLTRPIKPTDLHIQAIAEHEIGVHVRRAFAGGRGPLLLLETGLDRYLQGEEGIASYVQQQIEGAEEFYGFDRYLAASLAVGMDGQKRDFRSVFSLMTDYYTLKFETEEDEKHPTPFRAAWDVCVRIFRGTTGQLQGCVYTKDIVYMEGNIGIWHLLSEKPHVFEWLFLGKYNPLIKRHVSTLQTLEIMPKW